jgi:hypothetical protein
MATNDFLPFANGGGANVLTQAQYAALTALLSGGYQSGVANSAQMNKTWRQSSIMAAVLGQFAADYSGNNSVDDGTIATLEANLVAAIRSATKTGVILADTGATNAYTAVNSPPLVAGTWVDGVVQQVKIAHANTGASTYAPDGLTAIPIYGLGLQPLQGGELALNGTAVLMRATIPGVNSGNPIAVLMECAGGAQQIAPATQSQHAVQMAQAAGVVGSVRNLVMSVATSSASATLTADEIIVETALGGVRYCLPSFNKTINLATTGAGGMDTGTAPLNGFVAIYAIYNPTTGTSALLAKNAATLAANVYNGANMPAGFTASALISVWPTNGSGQMVFGYQEDRNISFAPITVLTTSTPNASLSALVASGALPANAVEARGNANAVSTGASTSNGTQIASDPNSIAACANQISATTANQSFGTYRLPVRNNSQTIYWAWILTGGTASAITISVVGYRI